MSALSPRTLVDALNSARRRQWTADTRNKLIAAAVVPLLALLTVLAVRDTSSAVPPVDLQVISTGDPLGLGATTEATVELHNRGRTEILPRFSVSLLAYPYYWRTVSGPPTLGPKQSATYRIQAPDALAAPPDGVPFQIKVNDARGITYVISSPIAKAKPLLPIVNPSLGMWTQRDPLTRLVSPVGWNIYSHRDDDDRATIEPATELGVGAVRFHVVQSGKPDPGGWTTSGLVQDIPFPDRPFAIRVLTRTPYEATAGGWLVTAFGIVIRFGEHGSMWLLFQPTGKGDLEYDLPDGNHIQVYDVPDGQWATRTIDLTALFRRMHWGVPETVRLSLFIGASSARPNDVEGYIAGLQLASGTQGTSAAK